MKFLKQKISLLLALSLVMTGCNFPASDDQTVKPETQKKAASSDFKEEKELLNSIPKDGIFFAFQNSDVITNKVETITNNIVETINNVPSIDLATRMLISKNKEMIFEYFKQIQYGAILIQAKGERLKNGDIDLLLNEDTDEKEALNYFAEEACVALATEIDIKEYQYFIDQAKKNMVPIIKYNKVGNVNIFSFGNCAQEDLDFLSNRANLKDNNIITLSDNNAADFEKIKTAIDNNFYQKAGDDPNVKYFKNLQKDITNAFNELNFVKITNDTNSAFYTLKIDEDKIKKTKIIQLDSNEKLEILKNSLIGKSMQRPMYLTEEVNFTFKHKTEDNTIYYQENTENLDWSILMNSSGSGVGPLVIITVIGILATGASTVYTSAQQKARDSIRQQDLMMLQNAAEMYYGNNERYPEQIEELVDDGYMTKIPNDPNGSQYTYEVSSDGQEFNIGATLETSGKNNLFKVGNY